MNKNTASLVADWVLRLTLAIVFISAGYEKLFITGPAVFAAHLNVPVILGWMASLGEFGGGICIIIGGLINNKYGDIITRLFGVLLAFIMVVAFFMVHVKGFSPDFLKGLEGSYDVIALFAIGLFYTLIGNTLNAQSDSR